MNRKEKLPFASDYMQGAHPAILQALQETNLEPVSGYGTDSYCTSARERIREACACPEAEVFFLSGGTQANALCLDRLLALWPGVLPAETGHIATHEACAIEYTGHKILPLPQKNGKVCAEDVRAYCATFFADANNAHMTMPGALYLSQTTEYGTLYSLQELEELRAICDTYSLKLYLDGARLAYALAVPENDVTLRDLARLCDVFYIGGTKCGALLGEAVVIPNSDALPHFFTSVKQHGALLAKGRILGLQFDTLFRDGLYEAIGRTALQAAARIRAALVEKGYELFLDSPSNQLFVVLEDTQLEELARNVTFSFWEKKDETHTVIRLATSWATSKEDVDTLIELL